MRSARSIRRSAARGMAVSAGTALAILAAAHAAAAAELRGSSLEKQGKRYRVSLQMYLDAPVGAVNALLADFARMSELNPGVRESEVVGRSNQAELVRLSLHACAMLFCPDFELLQTMLARRDGETYHIDAEVQPGADGEMRYGVAHWTLRACGTGTCMDFDSTMEPGIWIPPLVGPWLIRRSMVEQTELTARNIERLITQRAQ